jgi:UDP-N-acetylmuramyl pentapeptide phosphotransferase/UDP-N-acetylglucosamine-1-phosphate transferase
MPDEVFTRAVTVELRSRRLGADAATFPDDYVSTVLLMFNGLDTVSKVRLLTKIVTVASTEALEERHFERAVHEHKLDLQKHLINSVVSIVIWCIPVTTMYYGVQSENLMPFLEKLVSIFVH